MSHKKHLRQLKRRERKRSKNLMSKRRYTLYSCGAYLIAVVLAGGVIVGLRFALHLTFSWLGFGEGMAIAAAVALVLANLQAKKYVRD